MVVFASLWESRLVYGRLLWKGFPCSIVTVLCGSAVLAERKSLSFGRPTRVVRVCLTDPQAAMAVHPESPAVLEAALSVLGNLAGEDANGALLMASVDLIASAMLAHPYEAGVQEQVRPPAAHCLVVGRLFDTEGCGV